MQWLQRQLETAFRLPAVLIDEIMNTVRAAWRPSWRLVRETMRPRPLYTSPDAASALYIKGYYRRRNMDKRMIVYEYLQ